MVGAADLKAVTPGNELVKFADDTYIVIPAANDSSRQTELNHVAEWARKNNLKTNPAKFAEIVFLDNRKKKPVTRQLGPSTRVVETGFKET